jgi:hypothetical protein
VTAWRTPISTLRMLDEGSMECLSTCCLVPGTQRRLCASLAVLMWARRLMEEHRRPPCEQQQRQSQERQPHLQQQQQQTTKRCGGWIWELIKGEHLSRSTCLPNLVCNCLCMLSQYVVIRRLIVRAAIACAPVRVSACMEILAQVSMTSLDTLGSSCQQ